MDAEMHHDMLWLGAAALSSADPGVNPAWSTDFVTDFATDFATDLLFDVISIYFFCVKKRESISDFKLHDN